MAMVVAAGSVYGTPHGSKFSDKAIAEVIDPTALAAGRPSAFGNGFPWTEVNE